MFLLSWVPQSAVSTCRALVLSQRNFRFSLSCQWNPLSSVHRLQDVRRYSDVHHLTTAVSPFHMGKGGKENSDKEHLERSLRFEC